MPTNACISPDPFPATVDALRHVLGNTCRLAQTTLNCHWNVSGPDFFTWHEVFERQYVELWDALDPLGERVRALGAIALADRTDRLVVPVFGDHEPVPLARMVDLLARGHDEMGQAVRAAIDIAREADDEATIALLGERLLAHERYRWQLRASLGS